MNGPTPGAILEISHAYWQSCALHAGVKLDLFTMVEQGFRDAVEIARGLDLDPRATANLLHALAAMGFLKREGEAFVNAEESRRFLVKGSPRYMGHIILHHHHLVAPWSRLDEAVKSGQAVQAGSHEDEEKRESFLLGMFNLAMGIAPSLVKELDLSGRRRLLDLGGGPGTYAIHFCLENKSLHATVADLAATRPFAEATIARFGVNDRVRFVPCNYHSEDIEGRYDVAWLSHILHGESPDMCRRMLEKAIGSLESGGMLMIHEFILNNTGDGPLFPALFSLNMLINTEGGRSYTEAQIVGMMRDAGVRSIRRLPFRGPNDSGIICGER